MVTGTKSSLFEVNHGGRRLIADNDRFWKEAYTADIKPRSS